MTFDDWIKDNAPVGVAYNLADMRRGWEGCLRTLPGETELERSAFELNKMREMLLKQAETIGALQGPADRYGRLCQENQRMEQLVVNRNVALDKAHREVEELEAKVEELTALKLKEFVEAHQQFLRGALPNLGPSGGLWRATDYGALGGSGGGVKEIPAGYTIPVGNTIRSDGASGSIPDAPGDGASGSIPDAPGDGASGNEYSATYGKQLRKIRSND